jgi:DNA-binding FadR family transcriptional regulator
MDYRVRKPSPSNFIQYLASVPEDESEHLPPLNELSKALGVSVASLREQLEVAKALGLVEVRPRTGMRRLPYSFSPAVWQSLSYSISLGNQYFNAFTDLRNHIEAAYWEEAVRRLTGEDHEELRRLMIRAWNKLQGQPVEIPHDEHRKLHLKIYCRLENAFVQGILESYWDAYEKVGLNVYTDFNYLEQVWNYHQEMVDAVCRGDFQAGFHALIAHKDLLYVRSISAAETKNGNAKFE